MLAHLRNPLLAAFALLACAALPAQQPQPTRLTVDTSAIVAPVSPMLYGLMTEEINHSYEGGLYAEMVANRTMRTVWSGFDEWQLVQNGAAQASMALDKTTGPSTALPTSLKLAVTSAAPGSEAGVLNPGWWGMAVRPGTKYSGSFYAKAESSGPLTARLVDDATGGTLASAAVPLNAGGWAKYDYTLLTGMGPAPGFTGSANHLELTLAQPGTVWLQLVSLFPPTYKNRVNGNRPDLMAAMAAMHPRFLRLPGGNYLEGDTLADRYDFKKTIGPLVDRPGHQAPWNYWSTDGLGLLEFLEWTEDLNIEPVLAVYAGYALKGAHVATGKDLEPYVQDALDEMEYVTGDSSTKWGAQRIRDGHPAPFPLHYIEIGNEDWFDKSGSYDARFAQFALALRKRFPQYKLIATTPLKQTQPGGEPDVIDDHYYKSPADMFALVHHYDTAPRTGPKIFVGEWATRSGSVTPNFGDALGDAALMTSMERNSDLIVMASYAPLLVNTNPGAMQWSTDLIGFDANGWSPSPSYVAQALFAGSLGDARPKTELAGPGEDARFFYSATVSTGTRTLHLKLVNASTEPRALEISLPALGRGTREAHVAALHGGSYRSTFAQAKGKDNVIHSVLPVNGGSLRETVPPLTIQVIDLPLLER